MRMSGYIKREKNQQGMALCRRIFDINSEVKYSIDRLNTSHIKKILDEGKAYECLQQLEIKVDAL